nr:thermonuclease family protein [Allocoleopsis franciscana]
MKISEPISNNCIQRVNNFRPLQTIMSFRLIPKSFLWLSATILIITLGGCEALQNLLGGSSYPVKRVSDGDTITVTDSSGKNISVRFACVDAPEVPHKVEERKSRKLVDKSQFKWGEKAQQRVQQLVKQGGDRVKLTVTDTDQYGRKISEVRLTDGTFIQQVLVTEGLAQVYRPYLKNCPSAAIIDAAEADAKKRRVGVWSDKKYVSAWEWRRNNK